MRLKTIACLLVLGLLGFACGDDDSTAEASTAGGMRLNGAVENARTWSMEELAARPLQTQDLSFLAEGTEKTLHAQGVLLYDLLQQAKPKFDPKRKRDSLRHAILIHATDGYESVVAWGEIDPDFAAKPVLVTVEENGKKLERPGVTMPGDKHGGRHVFDVDRISLEVVGDS